MDETDNVCSSDPEDLFVLKSAPDSVLGLSVEVEEDELDYQHLFFPKLAEEIGSEVEDLRQIEKEGENLIYSTSYF